MARHKAEHECAYGGDDFGVSGQQREWGFTRSLLAQSHLLWTLAAHLIGSIDSGGGVISKVVEQLLGGVKHVCRGEADHDDFLDHW